MSSTADTSTVQEPSNSRYSGRGDSSLPSSSAVVNTGPCDDHLYHKQRPERTAPGTYNTVNQGMVDKQSWDYVIRSGICGGIAGSSAKTLMAPLDRVKILFQTSNPSFTKYTGSWLGFWRAGKHIFYHEGFRALYQGHSATLLRVFPYASIKFVTYEQIRAILIRNKQEETVYRRLAAGAICGVTSVFCTYPLDLIRVRLAYGTQGPTRGRLWRTIQRIWAEPNASWWGASNFYRGFVPTVVGMVPYAGVSFWAHDVFHDIFRSRLFRWYTVSEMETKSSRKPLKAWAQLTAGGIAGVAAQTASYPFEVIRRRMQVGGAVGTHAGMLATGRGILKRQGIQGLFIGLTIGYMKVVPMFACSFFVYERFKVLLGI